MMKHSDLTPAQKAARVHYYHMLRRDGASCAVAWHSALAQVFFRASLKAQVADHKKRSKAAKRGWFNRRAGASL